MKKRKIMKVLLAIDYICHNQYKEYGMCDATCPLYNSACFTVQHKYGTLEDTADAIEGWLKNERKNKVNVQNNIHQMD